MSVAAQAADKRLAHEVQRLVTQVSHWTPARWVASSVAGPGTRGDAIHALAQELADLAAEAEGEPRRTVPRLPNDAALPDQLRVLAADVIAAATPEVVLAAAERVLSIRREL